MRDAVMVATLACAIGVFGIGTTHAQTPMTVRAMLGGGDEVPPVSAGAHGEALVTIDRAAGTLRYEVTIYNLPTGILAAHIHAATAGTNGPIVIPFVVPTMGQSGTFQLGGTVRASELVQRPESGIRTFDDIAFAIASGAAYVNVHTQANPAGEIRGQLCPPSAEANTFNHIALCTQPRR